MWAQVRARVVPVKCQAACDLLIGGPTPQGRDPPTSRSSILDYRRCWCAWNCLCKGEDSSPCSQYTKQTIGSYGCVRDTEIPLRLCMYTLATSHQNTVLIRLSCGPRLFMRPQRRRSKLKLIGAVFSRSLLLLAVICVWNVAEQHRELRREGMEQTAGLRMMPFGLFLACCRHVIDDAAK